MGNILNTKNNSEHMRWRIVDGKKIFWDKKRRSSMPFSIKENTKANNKYSFTNSKFSVYIAPSSPVFFIKKY